MALNSIYPPNAENIADSNQAAQRAAVSMFFLSSIIFSLSFGPVSWTVRLLRSRPACNCQNSG
jgi:hypothetical protein